MADKNETPGSRFEVVCKARSADTGLGLVFGVGMVCKVRGADGNFEPYIDTQDDHIPDEEMLKASTDFMVRSRALKAMHDGKPVGEVVHSFPLTEELAKVYDLQTNQTMWLVAVKPGDPGDVEKFRSGEWTGFSIGGHANSEETSR
jgi:hypothetical protein